jgi:hypothetical protein
MAGVVDFKTDDDDDLVIESGDFVVIDGPEATAQLIRARLQTIKGELAWDLDAGFPHDELIGDADVDVLRVQAWVRYTVLTTPGVTSCNELTFVFDDATRELTFDGTAIYDGNIEIPLRETLKIEVPA